MNEFKDYINSDIERKLRQLALDLNMKINNLYCLIKQGNNSTIVKGNTFSAVGTGIQFEFNIPHGLGRLPTFCTVNANSTDAANNFYITWNSTEIKIIYIIAPPLGTQLSWSWEAFKIL